MDDKLRWGIIGTGNIARKFARGLAESRTGRLAAVGSRAEETLRAFLADFPARGYASYDGLLADPEVDVVYISTPHPSHAQWAMRAAQAGKHVLCEKPLTMNAPEAAAVLQAAGTARVFLMEAFMYRCHPQTARLLELIRGGKIGAVRLVEASFSFRTAWNPQGRLLNRALGGGGILDVGGYCVSMARLIAGAAQGAPFADPGEVKALGQLGETGVDELAAAVLKFPGGMLAQLSCGVRVPLENCVRVWGEEGHIEVPRPWVVSREPGESVLRVWREGSPVEEVMIHSDRGIYAVEADAVAESIGAGESPAMSWADSLGNMRTLDRWRGEIGLRYEGEEPNG
jgi:predicted dehydrogenase